MMLSRRAGLAAILSSLMTLAACGKVETVNGGDVAVAPSITSQPASQVVTSGERASFSVVAAGSDPLVYQWRRNGTAITGAASPTYAIPASESDDGAEFSVLVSNPAGSTESEVAKLTVNPAVVAPSITMQPSSQTVAAGQSVSFTVAASGTAPLSYQWQKNGAAIAGATAATYTALAVTSADSGANFTVVVTNSAGSVTSSSAMLTVAASGEGHLAPAITAQPLDQAVKSGQTATFSVSATGSAPLTYQWTRNGVPLSGAGSASYTTPVLSAADSGATFAVSIKNSAGSVTSRAALLTVSANAPTIATQPADQSVKAGQSATFSVVASGTAPLGYQWHRNGVAIAGATAANYATPATSTADSGATFSVRVSNAAGKVTSRAAKLTVSAVAPAITTQPADQSVRAGQSATFAVVASGTAPLGYQWQKNGVAIAGATTASYKTPATSTADSGATFSVLVSNAAGKVTSRAAKLTVSAVAPSITTQPADVTVSVGASAQFSVAASGTAPLSYQWQKAGVAIAGATAATYTTPPAANADSGSRFAVVVTNASGSVTSRTAVLTVASTSPKITSQPSDQSVHSGQTATFNVTASGSAPLSYQWRKNGSTIAGATATSYTTAATSAADSGTLYSVTVSNAAGSITSRNAQLTVSAAVTPGSDVVTYKNDLARTGQNLNEKTLTPANVNSSGFGKVRFLSTDGKVDAQPLYLSALSIGGTLHNVVFVATENDSVYAFDADSGAVLWKASLVPTGETVDDLPPQSCSQVSPTIGITSTPVIDRGAGAHGTIYLVAMSKSSDSATWHHRLHALDVTTGAELLGGPKEITATYPSAGGTITFDPVQYEERAALLLSNHTIYTTWTSHCDHQFYTGWIIAYSQATLQQSAVLNVAPNSGGQGPAIWMAGGGPAADGAGNVYLLTANGVFEETLDANGFPNQHDYANSFLKLSTAGGSLTVADYFALSNTNHESSQDMDLGSGGIMLLPDLADAGGTTRHLAVGAGKDGNIYVVNRDSMGHFSRTGNNIWQQLTQVLGNRLSGGELGGVWATPAYFNGHVYYGANAGHLTSFAISGAKLSATPSSSNADFGYPGTSPVVSANGTGNGIVWAHQNANPAVLYAFDATNVVHEIYNSSQAGSRDQFGAGNKFITPMVADGKVFVGTTNGVAVFGLLN